ncbi:MAG TPA: TIGR04283 family arsenosugar biosynthesis glycosyltransferase [Candidatus Saccharimonadales bacterium]|nr:TIGR04283 family arsenosugar biosynthesis glycosyltransferase [Candidatus Saccharimonadales bacterium]
MIRSARQRLILFTRFPSPGKVKTRLIPALGPEGAAALHRRLVLRTLRAGREACRTLNADLEIHFESGSDEQMRHWLGEDVRFQSQVPGDLGNRMATAFAESFRSGSSGTIIIGTDCPRLDAQILTEAFARLQEKQVVLGPAQDGGYYLIGLTGPLPELFHGIPWGTDRVLADSMEVLERMQVTHSLLNVLEDIDRPEDLKIWETFSRADEANLSRVSVVIPTLNEEQHITSLLDFLRAGSAYEIIVTDGGSTDATIQVARKAGVLVVGSQQGRAAQMNAGAAQASGNVLFFLHVDTRPPADWANTIAQTVLPSTVAGGAFRLSIAGNFSGKRFVEWFAGIRSSWLQLPYGDQGLFLRRSVFEEMGGFAPLPIMEDFEFIRRLRKRGRVVTVCAAALTSGRRWERMGVLRTTAMNQLMLAGYYLGISPHRLTRFYRRHPRSNES